MAILSISTLCKIALLAKWNSMVMVVFFMLYVSPCSVWRSACGCHAYTQEKRRNFKLMLLNYSLSVSLS